MFDETKLKVGNIKTFKIKALNNPKENKYIQSAILDGQPFKRTWIGHDEIIAGKMGPDPIIKWGVGKEAVPPSATQLK